MTGKDVSRRVFLRVAGSAVAASPSLAASPGAADPGAEPVYLSDMSRCLPGSALSKKPRRNHWRLLDYETETFQGVMLVAGRNTDAPEIRYPVKQKGWYAISFALRSYGPGEAATKLQVRLARDSTFSMIRHHPGAEEQLDDYYWRTVELNGEDELVLRQFCRRLVPDDPDSLGNSCNGVWLAYIKLVPLTDAQASALGAERESGETRVLYCHNDAWSYTYSYRPTTEADIRREIEPFRETDFSRIYWEAGMGDRLYYPSRLGRITAADEWIDDPYRVGDRLATETWQTWRRQGIDPLRVAVGYAHEIGLEFHATYRPSDFTFPFRRMSGTKGAPTISIRNGEGVTSKGGRHRACRTPLGVSEISSFSLSRRSPAIRWTAFALPTIAGRPISNTSSRSLTASERSSAKILARISFLAVLERIR